MALERAEALVLRKIDYRDSDYIVTLFGRETGKFAGIAKGARKLDSKFGGGFDLLNLIEVVFYQGSGLDFISETELITNWETLRESSEAINAGLRCARAVNQLLEEGQKEEGVYVLTKKTFAYLDRRTGNSGVLELSFYLKLFGELGYRPQFSRCSKCGRSLRERSHFHFHPEAGGIVCDECARDETISVSSGLRKVMMRLGSTPQGQISRLRVTEEQMKRGLSLLRKFGRFHFDREVVPRRGM